MTTECYDLVREFHAKYGFAIFNPRKLPTTAQRHLRVRLLLEELGETVVAWHEKDRVLLADGLADLAYVTAGAAVCCLADDKVPDPWQHSTKHKIPPVKLAMDVVNLCNHLHNEQTGIILCIQAAVVLETIQAIASAHKVPLRKCFLEVHKSNMTKTVSELEDGQKGALKGPGYRPPNLAPFL